MSRRSSALTVSHSWTQAAVQKFHKTVGGTLFTRFTRSQASAWEPFTQGPALWLDARQAEPAGLCVPRQEPWERINGPSLALRAGGEWTAAITPLLPPHRLSLRPWRSSASSSPPHPPSKSTAPRSCCIGRSWFAGTRAFPLVSDDPPGPTQGPSINDKGRGPNEADPCRLQEAGSKEDPNPQPPTNGHRPDERQVHEEKGLRPPEQPPEHPPIQRHPSSAPPATKKARAENK